MPLSIGIGISPVLGGGAIVSFDVAKTQLLADLTAAGWTNLDVLDLFGDPVSPYANKAGAGKTLSLTGSASLTANRGITPDGSTGYLLGLGAPNSFTNFTQNSAHIGMFILRAGNQTGHIGRTGSTDGVVVFAGPSLVTSRLNSASADTWTVENAIGATSVVRTDASTVTAYKRGVSLGAKTRASTALSTNALSLLRASTAFCSDTMGAFWMGGALTPQQITDGHQAFVRFFASLGWTDIPAPATGTLTALSTTQLPDGSGAAVGKGFGCTGLVADPLDGTFWAGNDGRALGTDPNFAASVLHLAADFSVIAEYPVSAFTSITPNNKMSVQGVAVDTSVGATSPIRVYVKDTTGTGSAVVKLTRAGVDTLAYTDTASGGSLNGLAYDSINDRDIFSGTAAWGFKNKTTGAAIGDNVRLPGGAAPDQLYFDAALNRVWVSGGANGVDGNLWVYDVVNNYNFPVLIKTLTLASSKAVEGISRVGSTLYVNNDEYLHDVAGKQNVVRTYDATGI